MHYPHKSTPPFKIATLRLAALTVLALTAALAQTSHAQTASVVGFDDLTGSGTLSNSYQGIDWTARSTTWHYYGSAQNPYNAASGTERIYTSNSQAYFTFQTPVVFDGAYFAGMTSASQYFTLYDANNNLLYTSGSLTDSSTPTFLASGYGGAVKSIAVNSGQPGYFVMDNVTYHPSALAPEPSALAAPEPSSVAAFGFVALGAAGLILKARKRTGVV